jgi:hypothetical protein
MSQTFIQALAVSEVTTPTTNRTFTANVTGCLLFTVCRVASTGIAGTLSVADDGNGAWTPLPPIPIAGTAEYLQAFYFLNSATPNPTVTLTNTGGVGTTQWIVMIIAAWSGANFINNHIEGTVSSTLTPTSGSVSPTNISIAIGYGGLTSFNPSTPQNWDNGADPSYIVRDTIPAVYGIYSKENQGPGTYGFTAEFDGSAQLSVAGLATFSATASSSFVPQAGAFLVGI